MGWADADELPAVASQHSIQLFQYRPHRSVQCPAKARSRAATKPRAHPSATQRNHRKPYRAPAVKTAAPSLSRTAPAAAPRSLLCAALRLRSAAPLDSLDPEMRSGAVRPASLPTPSLQSALACRARWEAAAEPPCALLGSGFSRGFTATRLADPCAASESAAAAARGLGFCGARCSSEPPAAAASAAGNGRRKSSSRPSSSSPVKSVQRRGLPAMHR